MDLSPQRIRTAEFTTVKKGLDPDEVRSFLIEVAAEFERVQNQSTAMEARARAAVARLQEISESTPPPTEPQPVVSATPEPQPVQESAPTSTSGDEVHASVDQAQTISRTLLLAQRTADTTIAEAEAEAARLRSAAEEEATRTLDSTREMSTRLLDEAREEARRTGEAERLQVESEVNSLLARRDFLESDVDHLQTFLVDQRSRLRDAAGEILDLAERVPGGLGEVRRPLLSASDDDVETSRRSADGPSTATTTTSTGTSASAGTSATAASSRDSSGESSSAPQATTSTGEIPTTAAGSERPDAGAEETSDDEADVEASSDDEVEPDETEAVERDPLVIQTDIADEGPTGFSYDSGR